MSNIKENADSRLEIFIGFVNFCDKKKLHNFFESNIIDYSHPVKETDVLVHACSNDKKSLSFSTDEPNKLGATSVEFIDNKPNEAYSEIWLDNIITKYSIDLNDKEGLRNLGRLIAITAIHEAMHNKCEPFMQIDKPKFNLHRDGGGGIAEEFGSIFMKDNIWDSPINAHNTNLISKFINLPLKQTRRIK